MPQVIARYNPAVMQQREPGMISHIESLGLAVIPLIAEAASTHTAQFTEDDIEWIPLAHELGTIAPDFAIEIRTIGFPGRKAKMDREAMIELRKKIVALIEFPKSCRHLKPLIWLQFIDPDGVHV